MKAGDIIQFEGEDKLKLETMIQAARDASIQAKEVFDKGDKVEAISYLLESELQRRAVWNLIHNKYPELLTFHMRLDTRNILVVVENEKEPEEDEDKSNLN